MLSEQNGEYVASFTGGTTDDILESIVAVSYTHLGVALAGGT